MIGIEKNINLKAFNTFGVDAVARYFCRLRQPNELVTLFENEDIRAMVVNPLNILVLGRGAIYFLQETTPAW